MKNETIPTATVKARFKEAQNNVQGLKVEIKFWLQEKDEALNAGDEHRILDAILELKELDRKLAYAELDMMYFYDILVMRHLREETI